MPSSRPLKLSWFHILLALANGDRHGYGIQRDVLDRTDGRLRLWPAMLYRALDRLEAAKLIRRVGTPSGAPNDVRRVYYRITRHGRQRLTEEAGSYATWAEAARRRT